jgi:hypothetical protein
MRGNGRRESVVLVLETVPNCRQRNASIARGVQLALRSRNRNDMPTNPISRSGRLFEPRRRDRSLGGQLALSLSTWGAPSELQGRPRSTPITN